MCRFCGAQSRETPTTFPWDHRLVETDRFVALPSKGALVPGWVLLVPRVHVLSLSELSDDASTELEVLQTEVTRKLSSAFGKVSKFEHGATTAGTSFGCGIDHAHLHLVALPFDLATEVRRARPDWDWQASQPPWKQAPAATPYIALSNDGGWMEARPDSMPKQFFRRVIATALNLSAEYDYDLFPRPESADTCVSRLA
jgi:ATP adenylyltransferase